MEAPITVDVKGRPCQEQLDLYRLTLSAAASNCLLPYHPMLSVPKLERYGISKHVLQAGAGLLVRVTGIAQSPKQSMFKLNAMNGPWGKMACMRIRPVSHHITMSHNSGVID
jgi:hypothetical protein